MFTRAGSNPQHIVLRRAQVTLHREPGARTYAAKLIRFEPSGDLAWYSREGQFLVWEERAIEAPA